MDVVFGRERRLPLDNQKARTQRALWRDVLATPQLASAIGPRENLPSPLLPIKQDRTHRELKQYIWRIWLIKEKRTPKFLLLHPLSQELLKARSFMAA